MLLMSSHVQVAVVYLVTLCVTARMTAEMAQTSWSVPLRPAAPVSSSAGTHHASRSAGSVMMTWTAR